MVRRPWLRSARRLAGEPPGSSAPSKGLVGRAPPVGFSADRAPGVAGGRPAALAFFAGFWAGVVGDPLMEPEARLVADGTTRAPPRCAGVISASAPGFRVAPISSPPGGWQLQRWDMSRLVDRSACWLT